MAIFDFVRKVPSGWRHRGRWVSCIYFRFSVSGWARPKSLDVLLRFVWKCLLPFQWAPENRPDSYLHVCWPVLSQVVVRQRLALALSIRDLFHISQLARRVSKEHSVKIWHLIYFQYGSYRSKITMFCQRLKQNYNSANAIPAHFSESDVTYWST